MPNHFTRPAIIATVHLQAWSRDYALDLGDTEQLDITAAVLALTAAEIADLKGLGFDTVAAKSGLDHIGPFAWDPEERIKEFFTVDDLEDITDSDIEEARRTLGFEAYGYLSEAQRAVLKHYNGGQHGPEFEKAYTKPLFDHALEHCGDGLLRFLLAECGDTQGCDSLAKARNRVCTAARELQRLHHSLIEAT